MLMKLDFPKSLFSISTVLVESSFVLKKFFKK